MSPRHNNATLEMGVLLPIRGLVTMITITGLFYDPENTDTQTFDYAMIDGNAAECVIFKDDSGDYMDLDHDGEDVQNVTTLNVKHINDEVILQAIQVIEFENPIRYLNMTDKQVKEFIEEGSVKVTEAEITMPKVVADVISKERNDTGITKIPSVVLVIKEEEKCLIIVKHEKQTKQ